jgi:hypothetical protein
MVLAPENIVLKTINGHRITSQELVEYFKVGFCLQVDATKG